jgi:hypothetical protein
MNVTTIEYSRTECLVGESTPFIETLMQLPAGHSTAASMLASDCPRRGNGVLPLHGYGDGFLDDE